ncbi:S-adenosyl-L-methionine-dependent methyltransferase [Aspergillus avenaceus]|uniref:S-adenosyl-L-methionine-dependent methyltransferase n=1 Tax=Aspergillus avenaceus TaxID=36643 RepID=A0A5N6TVM4_ASPAV|nr:S-adenosyl-L-methionine-dependent methyltransferase [Aspergillus avenaceus]
MSDFTEKNRQVFEKMARTYKAGFEKSIEMICRQVQKRRLWASDTWIDTEAGQGKDVKMLEYACGPGHVSAVLAPFVTKVSGVDLSDGMINEYNLTASEVGISDKMVGRKGDLLADAVPEEFSGPDYTDLDVVFVSMALHHFEKPDLAMKRLGDRLRKDGVFLVIDILPEGHHDHNPHEMHKEFQETKDTIKTHGFTLEDMRKLYEDAGLGVNFDFQVIDKPLEFQRNGKTFAKTIFIAKGQRQ